MQRDASPRHTMQPALNSMISKYQESKAWWKDIRNRMRNTLVVRCSAVQISVQPWDLCCVQELVSTARFKSDLDFGQFQRLARSVLLENTFHRPRPTPSKHSQTPTRILNRSTCSTTSPATSPTTASHSPPRPRIPLDRERSLRLSNGSRGASSRERTTFSRFPQRRETKRGFRRSFFAVLSS